MANEVGWFEIHGKGNVIGLMKPQAM